MNNQEIIEILKKGGVGIFATDTAYGLGCVMDNKEAIERVFRLKKRPETKPLLVLASSIEMAEKYVEMGIDVKKLTKKYWPGGLTIILKCKRNKVLKLVTANSNTLAVRLPDNEILRSIIEKVGVPIVAPSANIAGEKTPYTLEEVDSDLIKKVDFVLPSECTMGEVSTILDAIVVPWKVVRQGVVKLSKYDLKN